VTLILNNEDVKTVLTMDIAMQALEKAYQELYRGEAVCRPRIDIQIPTSDPNKIYQWGTMEGGSASGYFAIRMKSDVIYEAEYEGARTQEKYCVQPGKFCGLILLVNIETGEPVALLNDGYLQHMRVGADSGIGVKYMAREDVQVVGMLGSGGMAHSHMDAFMLVRKIKRIQVYSPTKEHREQFAKEMENKFGIEAVAFDHPRDVYRGAHIIAGCTDSAVPIIIGQWLEQGTHVTSIGGRPDEDTLKRIDVSLRLGNAPAPWGLPQFDLADEYLTYGAKSTGGGQDMNMKRAGKRAHGVIAEERAVLLADLLSERRKGRTSPTQVTYSERGNIQGLQFFSVAGRVYELAREKRLGREIPTEWLLQDIRD
jgi:alanine dehydrogenase